MASTRGSTRKRSSPRTKDRLALLGLLVIAAITAYLVVRLFLHMP
ncbi:MAG: hypothetical protein Q8Q02_00035 [Nocardioides sp.]|nr:hypothetical protein [Nocardioides sp.]